MSRLRHSTVVVLGALLLSACQTLGKGNGPATQPVAPPPPPSPVVAFVASAQPGQSAVVRDPALGTVSITVERQYYAASGQICRRFNSQPNTGPAESLVMCQEATGWSIVRLPVNQ